MLIALRFCGVLILRCFLVGVLYCVLRLLCCGLFCDGWSVWFYCVLILLFALFVFWVGDCGCSVFLVFLDLVFDL